MDSYYRLCQIFYKHLNGMLYNNGPINNAWSKKVSCQIVWYFKRQLKNVPATDHYSAILTLKLLSFCSQFSCNERKSFRRNCLCNVLPAVVGEKKSFVLKVGARKCAQKTT